MKKTELLILASGQDNLDAMIIITNKNTNWNKTAALTDEDAIEKFHQKKFDVALVDASLKEESYKKVRTFLERQYPETVILHYTKNAQQLVKDILKINGQLSRKNKVYDIDPQIFQGICLN